MASPRRWALAEATLGVAATLVAAFLVAPHASGADLEHPASPTTLSLAPAPPIVHPDDQPEPPIQPLDARFDNDASLPAHAEVVHRTTLQAKLDPQAHTLHGEERIVWRNTSTEPANELWLHLYLNAFKNERTLFLRERLGEGRGSRLPSDWGYIDIERFELVSADGVRTDLWANAEKTSPDDPDDQTDIRIPLAQPCPAGGELELSIAFLAKLPTIVARTGYLGSFHMVGQWFPKLARHTRAGRWVHFPFHRLSEFDADFGSYDVTLDVPEGFVVGATGRDVEDTHAGGRAVSRWHADDVHDFAFTAWDEWTERTERMGDVDVRTLAPASHGPAIDRELTAVRAGLGCYGRRFGRYPYPTLTIVQPPLAADEAGGMEYPTLITTGGVWAGPPGLHLTEWVTMHELGHQIFYGAVATDEHRYPFLDEGLNSYAETACMEEVYGAASLVDGLGAAISVAAAHREGAADAGEDDVIARPAADFPSWHAYARLVYSRTATLLRTLGGSFGNDVVERALGRFARAYRFQHPDPRHLIAAFGDVGGDDVREALRIGLFERGWVDFAALDLYSARHNSPLGIFDRPTGRETLTQRDGPGDYDGWALITRRGNLVLPTDIDLLLADGSRRRTRWNGVGEWTLVRYQGPSQLVGAIVDPDAKIELDDRFSNDATTSQPEHIAWRAFERGAYAFGLVSLLAAP